MLLSLFFLWISLLWNFNTVIFENSLVFLDFIALNYKTISIDICLSLRIDTLSFLFLLLVITIGLATNCYSLNYFKNEADEGLFLFWLNSFVASMGLLVLAANYWSLFLGWELIGLTSFFLINFWYFRRGTLKSSFKAFTFNLVSDVFLLFSFINFFIATGANELYLVTFLSLTFSFSSTFYLGQGCIFLFLAASIKSVQLGGHLWLPDSMEAPVPASSLIHSATLVSAGVYLLVRFYDVLFSFGWHSLCLISGSITAAYGGIVAAAQTDMKKLLAYSTMSHCGFLYVCVGLGNLYLLITYLFLHGLFKAATFYCVGSFIRVFNSQDTRLMGGGSRLLPLDSLALIICSFNLGGLPFSIGYFYKKLFLSYFTWTPLSFIFMGCLILALLTGLVYTFRLVYFSVFDLYKGSLQYSLFFLQNTKVYFLGLYRVVTWGQLYALCILVSFSLVTYFLILYIFNFFFIELSTFSLLEALNLEFYGILNQQFIAYFILFYSLYAFFLVILFFGETRFIFLKSQAVLLILYGSLILGFLSLFL